MALVFFVVVSELFKQEIVRLNHASTVQNFLKSLKDLFRGFCFTFPGLENLTGVLFILQSFVFEVVVRQNAVVLV